MAPRKPIVHSQPKGCDMGSDRKNIYLLFSENDSRNLQHSWTEEYFLNYYGSNKNISLQFSASVSRHQQHLWTGGNFEIIICCFYRIAGSLWRDGHARGQMQSNALCCLCMDGVRMLSFSDAEQVSVIRINYKIFCFRSGRKSVWISTSNKCSTVTVNLYLNHAPFHGYSEFILQTWFHLYISARGRCIYSSRWHIMEG